MDHHGRYGQPAFTAGNPSLHFHSPTPIPSLVSEVPIYMHQVLNPNAPHNNTFNDTTTISLPLPPAPPHTYPHQTVWDGISDGINLNQGGTTIRWPRQETLTLLEIRSRLDHCFKEATSSNHKAPLWDEISRIMNEEYGYQRSGRKCKEKFENLYKYYKKTKEGKVGKNDGKHYRFFRQLEALFGDQQHTTNNNNNINIVDPSSQSNYSSEYGTTPSYEKNKRTSSSSDIHHYELKNKRIIAAIEASIELHFTQLMSKQEEWGEKILCTIESKEKERVAIEEEWRKQEGARLEQEYEAWASHVGRIEARDKSLLEYLQTLIRVKSGNNSKENGCCSSDNNEKCKGNWSESEISSLIHIRANKECKFLQDVVVDEEQHDVMMKRLWEEVAFELSLLGYKRTENDCKETWEKICVDFNKRKMEAENTRKEDSSRSYQAI
uniref:trihelix transcription factor PTL-like n=1 Tax=Erigeron canadensis TaxID=72917 RepID=UPI001CB8F8F9|nr:trihelix transcription factor PTL-like [Erigeron canadensis]